MESGVPRVIVRAAPWEGEPGELTTFSRGFLLTSDDIDTPLPGWRAHRFGDWVAMLDPRLPFIAVGNGIRSLLFIGEIRLGMRSTEEIAMDAFERWAGGGDLQPLLSSLGGRFVAIQVGSDGSVTAQAAGAALRPVFYSTTGGTLASHEHLAAAALRLTPDGLTPAKLRAASLKYSPGLSTSYSRLRRLTGNTRVTLSAGSATVARVPAATMTEISSTEAANVLTSRFRAQINSYFKDKERVLVPLTAGLDTRTTLSFLEPHLEKCQFFTYALRRSPRKDAVRSDVRTASRIATYLGVPHEVIEINEDTRPPEIRAAMALSNSRQSVPTVAWALGRRFPDVHHHLMSHMYEVGQAFYLKRRRPQLNPTQMAHMISRSEEAPATVAIQAFEDFVRLTDFDRSDPSIAKYDRFYWEHRMCVWASSALTDYDFAQNTDVLLSARQDLITMLSVPLEDRKRASVQHKILNLNWPLLSKFPVNE